jgi:hypothetical protein
VSNIKANQRFRFMQQLLERCAKKTSLFINVSPYSYQNWVATVAGKSGLMWQFTVLEKDARTELWFCSTQSAEINFRRFEFIKKHKEYIEKKLGKTLMWDFKESRKYQCIRYYSPIGGFKDESNWDAIQEDMIDHLLKMESLFKDLINQLE